MKDKQPSNRAANRFQFDDTPTFDKAEVPSYMLQLEIDSLPANRVFYLDADEIPTWGETPSMMVDKKTGKLHLVGTTEVDARQDMPRTPLEKVGVMRAETIDADGKIVSFYVADLRFVENHALQIVDGLDDAPADAEEFNSWMEAMKDLREVVAFIAPIPDTEASKKGIIPAAYHGPQEYYGALDDLRQRGDTLLAKSIKKQRRVKKLSKVVMKENPTQGNKENPAKAAPSVIFSNE